MAMIKWEQTGQDGDYVTYNITMESGGYSLPSVGAGALCRR